MMKAKWLQTVASAVVVVALAASAATAQAPAVVPVAHLTPTASPAMEAGQLDQMLAPIALYPDQLLGQVLMAAGYPLEVVQADRWLQDPTNAPLRGDQLAAAVSQQSWDPSVKALTAFPLVLNMMNGQLDWTESLGEAFIDNPAMVMDAIQRLRRQAVAAGKLRSNAQEVVADQNGVITITPVSPQTVYVPVYEPAVVYGPWPYPDWPPYYFPGYWAGCAFDDFGYCWFGLPIILPLWGWDHWDWGNHRIDIDRDRFTGLNRGHPPIGEGAWTHDPAHRGNVPYQSPSSRQQFQGGSNRPGSLGAARGYTSGPSALSGSRVPPTFQSYGAGGDVRAEAARGASSRAMTPSSRAAGPGGLSRGGGASRGGVRR